MPTHPAAPQLITEVSDSWLSLQMFVSGTFLGAIHSTLRWTGWRTMQFLLLSMACRSDYTISMILISRWCDTTCWTPWTARADLLSFSCEPSKMNHRWTGLQYLICIHSWRMEQSVDFCQPVYLAWLVDAFKSINEAMPHYLNFVKVHAWKCRV